MKIHIYGELSIDHIHEISDDRNSFRWLIRKSSKTIGGMGGNIAILSNFFNSEISFFSVFDEDYLKEIDKIKAFGLKYVPIVKGKFTEIYNLFFPKEPRKVVSIDRGDFLKEFEIQSGEELASDLLIVTPIFWGLAKNIPQKYSHSTLKVLAPALEYSELSETHINTIIEEYDLIFFDQTEAETYFGPNIDKAFECFCSLKDKCVVITNGEKEVVAIHDGMIFKEKIYKSDDLKICDTMGCGDAFVTAFSIYYLKLKGDVQTALKTAHQYAAIIASTNGMCFSFIENQKPISKKIKQHIKNWNEMND